MSEKKECFIIMPIGDPSEYPTGHFRRVYEDIIIPSCDNSGFKAVRADDVKETNLIHLDLLQKLIEAPIAICDLSTRNPNVLFELGIRQAFDKPVVLIQEKGTEKIFDIAPLRYLEYSKDMKYHDVLQTQDDLKEMIEATVKAENDNGNINSIVKLLALSNAATIPNLEANTKENFALEILQSEMRDMKQILELSMLNGKNNSKKDSILAIEYERISNKLDYILKNPKRVPMDKKQHDLHNLLKECDELIMYSDNKQEHIHYHFLMERIHKAMNKIT